MSVCTPIRMKMRSHVARGRSQVASETAPVDLPPANLPPANLTFICVSSICVFYLWFSLFPGLPEVSNFGGAFPGG